MAVRFSPEAQYWLQSGHCAVTLRVSTRHGCCGGSAGVPVAEPGTPADPHAYRHYVVEGIAVYLASELDTGQTYMIRVEGFFGLKRLFVEGAELSDGKG